MTLIILGLALFTGRTDEKPVQVYILSGQSNMVGIGQATPGGATRYNTYTQPDDKSEQAQGCTLSIYSGAYDPSIDYSTRKPVETHQVRLGYWPHASFPKIEGEQTQIARGYIHIDKPGRYSFAGNSNGSLVKIDGKIACDRLTDGKAKPKIIRWDKGTYPIEVIFNGVGQSNLTHAFYDVPGSLYTVVKEEGKYPHLLDDNGEWASRDDVWYKGVVTAAANQWLSIGCGAGSTKIGPELGFGWVMGDYHEEPVLILKASEGNRSLAWDFLPPGSKRFEVDGTMVAGYKDPKSTWPKGQTPAVGGWYAGKQYDDCFNTAKEVLANFDTHFPMWKGRGYEIAGFVWWQGHKDSGSVIHQQNYEKNLIALIKALRKDFNAPQAPFIVGTVGFHGWDLPEAFQPIAKAQLAVSDYEKHPEFKGNVKTVETRDFWKPAEESPMNQDYHYNQNGETYYLIGDAFGKGMVELLQGKAK